MTEPTTSYLRTRHSRTRLATPSMPSNACSIPAGCTKLMANSESPMQRHNQPTSAQFLLSFLFPEMGAEPFTLWMVYCSNSAIISLCPATADRERLRPGRTASALPTGLLPSS